MERIPRENKTFGVGEKFIFNIKYEFMTAGSAALEVEEGPLINNMPTYRIVSTAESKGFIDSFYRVRDRNESIIEKDTLGSLEFHQKLAEGRFKIERKTNIDYSSGTWTYQRDYKGKRSFRNGTVDKRVSDILSSFYIARMLPLELGQTYYIEVFSEDIIYPLKVVVGPKIVKIKVPAGKFDCLRVQPFMIGEGIFKSKDGNLLIYMTNDADRMPVLMQSKVFIGSVDAELVSYRLKDSEESVEKPVQQ